MKRIAFTPRENWQQKIKDQGFVFYKNYYQENACYQFSSSEISHIEKATNEIFLMCMTAMRHILQSKTQLHRFQIPARFHEIIKRSWDEDHISFYGRFDLAMNGYEIKLLEFNADTPTSLLEASVIQWYWLQDFDPSKDQFNSIHERLIRHLQTCKEYIPNKEITFCGLEDEAEDFMTVKYLEDCAVQAGYSTEFLDIHRLSINESKKFCNPEGKVIQTIFKLYPYEWMFHEEFSDYLIHNFEETQFIEPLYKAIWSNKMLMVILHELFPNSPYILKCKTHPTELQNYVKKPFLSREGSNVSIIKNNEIIEETKGEYGEEGFVYQEYFEVEKHEGKTPIIGSWVIGGDSAGMGIRESDQLITDNRSQFVPHFITH